MTTDLVKLVKMIKYLKLRYLYFKKNINVLPQKHYYFLYERLAE